MIRLQSANFKRKQYGQVTLVQREAHQEEWSIGRSDACDLQLDGDDISRYHARIKLTNGAFYFFDTSTNGSMVNGEVLSPQHRHLLQVGDKIEVGNTTLYIEDLEPPEINSVQSLPTSAQTEWTTQTVTLRCHRIVAETPDTKTFWFTAEPSILFSYNPGQFVMLEFDIDGDRVVRPYSLSSSPTRPHAVSITVKRVPDGRVSNWLNDELKVGDTVSAIGAPKGTFTCVPQLPSKLLLLSAGSGITPMMSMVRYLYDRGADAQTDIVFLYCARTQKDLIFYAELAAIAAQMKRFRLAITLSRPDPNLPWTGYTGRISPHMLQLIAPDFIERSTFVCGPDEFMSCARSILESLAFPMSQYQQESFGGKRDGKVSTKNPFASSAPEMVLEPETQPVTNSIATATAPSSQNGKTSKTATGTAPVVQFVRSQISAPANEDLTLLEIAEQRGVPIRSGCQAGVCGTCKVRLSKGRVRHNPEPAALTQAEQESGYVLACIAHPQGAIELEA